MLKFKSCEEYISGFSSPVEQILQWEYHNMYLVFYRYHHQNKVLVMLVGNVLWNCTFLSDNLLCHATSLHSRNPSTGKALRSKKKETNNNQATGILLEWDSNPQPLSFQSRCLTTGVRFRSHETNCF